MTTPTLAFFSTTNVKGQGMPWPEKRICQIQGHLEAAGVTAFAYQEMTDVMMAALEKEYPHVGLVAGRPNTSRNARGRVVGTHVHTVFGYDRRAWILHDHDELVLRAPVRQLHLPFGLLEHRPTNARVEFGAAHLVSGDRRAHHLVRVADVSTLRHYTKEQRITHGVQPGLMVAPLPRQFEFSVPALWGGDWNDMALPMGLPQERHRIDALVGIGCTPMEHKGFPFVKLGLSDHDGISCALPLTQAGTIERAVNQLPIHG